MYLQNVCRFHWILLDIQVDKSKVEVLDPLDRELEQFSAMQDMIQRWILLYGLFLWFHEIWLTHSLILILFVGQCLGNFPDSSAGNI